MAESQEDYFTEIDPDLRRLASIPKALCPYGTQCYRKNPQHFREMNHLAYMDDLPKVERFRIAERSVQRLKGIKKRSLPLEKNTTSNNNSQPSTSRGSEGLITSYFQIKPKKESLGKTRTFDGSSSPSDCEEYRIDTDSDPEEVKPRGKKQTRLMKRSLDSFSSNQNKKRSINSKQEEKVEEKSSQSKTPAVKLSRKVATSPPPTDEEARKLIEQLFLVCMPDDFFQFWKLCKEINRSKPTEALVNSLGFQLVGPFDVLTGLLNESHVPLPYTKSEKMEGEDDDEDPKEEEYNDPEDRNSILRHWRFFYDQPEVQTFAVSLDSSGYHLGYFRDDPTEKEPVIISSNPIKTKGKLTGIGDNIFAAFNNEVKIAKCRFRASKDRIDKIKQLEEKLHEFGEMKKIDIEAKSRLVARSKKVVARTLNGFGIVVPMQGEVGYRDLPVRDSDLVKIFERIDRLETDEQRRTAPAIQELQRIFASINYANDECDFGMGLELGLDLFVSGRTFHKSCDRILSMAYDLLKRFAFKKIIKSHLKLRREGNELSMV